MKKKTLIIHPILFALFPILSFFSHNKEQLLLNNSDFTISIAISILLALMVWLLLSFILKNKRKAGLLTSLFLLLFFSYGHFHNAIENFHLETNVTFNCVLSKKLAYKMEKIVTIGPDKLLFTTWGILFITATYFLIKTKRTLHIFTNFLNIVATSLVVISLINIVPYELKTKRVTWLHNKNTKNTETKPFKSKKSDPLPDIYYIILDAYARNDILSDIFDYDNTEFTNHLKKKGFYIASKSRTNYAHTFLSLASSLNMEYVNYFSETIGKESNDVSIPLQMIANNKVVSFLRSKGYKFINLGSGWAPTDQNINADIKFKGGSEFKLFGTTYGLNEFFLIFIKTTALFPLIETRFADDVRSKILYNFAKIREIPLIKEPTFTMAHFTVPHPPYLFDENGKPVPKAKLELIGDVYADKENYLKQLIFVSQMTQSAIDDILDNSVNQPIIILQSDHGSPTILGHPFNWERPPEKKLKGIKERLSILNGYYLPNDGNDLLYDSITPVNTFRLIFNVYFGTNYQLLPDESYYSDYINHYEFFNMTDKITSN